MNEDKLGWKSVLFLQHDIRYRLNLITFITATIAYSSWTTINAVFKNVYSISKFDGESQKIQAKNKPNLIFIRLFL